MSAHRSPRHDPPTLYERDAITKLEAEKAKRERDRITRRGDQPEDLPEGPEAA